ncbi:hydantoinase B/oxoprolinase family protein [Mesorhizobium sp. ANAO-SY3R2]|uniref:hydantoinase B/oxoprolinase family protein n=1 Tax=Mesorhizobium sp. ANAO-SY3R2 TaxID=3166644 RepID=UPI00366DC9A7
MNAPISSSSLALSLRAVGPRPALRGDGELDPITYEVIRHRLWSINQEGSTTIMHASGSPVVHATDYNFGIYMPNGDIAVSGTFYMIPLCTMTMMIQMINETFAGDIAEGDVFVTNDPFIASVHQNDVQLVAPYFHDGKLVAWTGCMAHLLDVGGKEPGSWVPDARSCFEEGQRIPILKIVRGGALDKGIWEMILGSSRLPLLVGNDFSALLASHRVSHERFREVCDRYGADAVYNTMLQTINDTEKEMRAQLGRLPDGEFRHSMYYDHDGHQNNVFPIRCTMHKRGDQLTFDLRDAHPQIQGMGNASKAGTLGAIATALLGTFGQELDWNAGLLGPISVLLADRTILSAEAPSPISGGSVTANWIASAAATACVAKMLAFSPEFSDYVCGPADGSWLLAQFGGLNQANEPYAIMYMDSLGWGGPAFRSRDGVDTGGSLIVPAGGFNDVELHEKTSPMLYLWRRELPDSGGAGQFRGGNGIEYSLAMYDTEVLFGTLASHGVSFPDQIGVLGGYPGSVCNYDLVRKSNWKEHLAKNGKVAKQSDLVGERKLLEAKTSMQFFPGDVVNMVVQNGGGYGDPLLRDPTRVEDDVRRGAVTIKTARDLYGVVLNDGSVDGAATKAAREEVRRKRLSDAKMPKARSAGNQTSGSGAMTWGAALSVGKNASGLVMRCENCGEGLGDAGTNWRDGAAVRNPRAEELGPHIRIDDRFIFEQLVCPHCATSLWVDTRKRDEASAVDFQLA